MDRHTWIFMRSSCPWRKHTSGEDWCKAMVETGYSERCEQDNCAPAFWAEKALDWAEKALDLLAKEIIDK